MLPSTPKFCIGTCTSVQSNPYPIYTKSGPEYHKAGAISGMQARADQHELDRIHGPTSVGPTTKHIESMAAKTEQLKKVTVHACIYS